MNHIFKINNNIDIILVNPKENTYNTSKMNESIFLNDQRKSNNKFLM